MLSIYTPIPRFAEYQTLPPCSIISTALPYLGIDRTQDAIDVAVAIH
jgi:hypothetical protein